MAVKQFHAGVYVAGEDGEPIELAVPDLQPHPAGDAENAIHLALEFAKLLDREPLGFWTRVHRPGSPTCCPEERMRTRG